MANIKDVAKKAGVAVSTVSKYINGGSVRSYNQEAIRKAIDELGFKINDVARTLKTNKAMTVGILIPNLESSFFTLIAALMEDCLQEYGYNAIVCDYRNDSSMEAEKLGFLISKRVDGVIAVPQGDLSDYDILKTQDIPAVVVDRPIDGMSWVVTDSYNGSKKAVEYLIANGHENIAAICGPDDVYTATERLRGYKDALLAAGIEYEIVKKGHYTLAGGYSCMKELLAQKLKPTATFVINHEMTMGAVIALNEAGVRMPEEMSIIGFDDMEMTKTINPPLTVVVQPARQISKIAADTLVGLMRGEKKLGENNIKLGTSLLIRKSVDDISDKGGEIG